MKLRRTRGYWLAASAAACLAVLPLGSLPLAYAGLLAPMFTRLDGEGLLRHGTRRRILEVVAARPGVTLQAVQEELGVAWGTAMHHVGLLHRHGELVSVRQGPRRLLFAARTPEARARAGLAVLRNPTATRIAQAVAERPGATQSGLADELGLRAGTLSKHLARLRAAGLVLTWKEGASIACGPAPGLAEALRMAEGCQPATRPPRPARIGAEARRAATDPERGPHGGLQEAQPDLPRGVYGLG